ncbi:hypothetical protein Bca4012_025697 [Brassica carinata]
MVSGDSKTIVFFLQFSNFSFGPDTNKYVNGVSRHFVFETNFNRFVMETMSNKETTMDLTCGRGVQDQKETLLSIKEECFRNYVLIQYIWYRNILLKSWNASRRKQQYEAEKISSLFYGDIRIFVKN